MAKNTSDDADEGLPWWAWVLIVLGILLFIILVIYYLATDFMQKASASAPGLMALLA